MIARFFNRTTTETPHNFTTQKGGPERGYRGRAMIGRAEDGTLAALAVADSDERELEVRGLRALLRPVRLMDGCMAS